MIRIAKLINGDEIIGLFDKIKDNYIVFYPVKVEEVVSDDGKPSIDLSVYGVRFKDARICINENNILFIGNPVPELENYYQTLIPKSDSNSATAGEGTSTNSTVES